MRVLGLSVLILFVLLMMLVVLVWVASQTLQPKTHHSGQPDLSSLVGY